jgi:nitrous oxide reductase accessory protein NosL
MKPGPTDRCPVCGMFPHKNPKWAAGIMFQDGAAYVHCSPKCMLHNLHNISKYQPTQKKENIKQIWVTEYYSTKPMDANEVLFVTGATLTGPMGRDIVPVKGREAAENLMRDYKGQQILPLDGITDDIVEQARKAKKAHP